VSVVLEPDRPWWWENPIHPILDGKLRGEILNAVEAFATVLEARVLAEDFRMECYRPYSSLGQLTSAEFVESWHAKQTDPN
jgi:hypothetical protein